MTASEEVCFRERRPERLLGLVSLGFFLLAVGIAFIANPSVTSDFQFWIEQMTEQKSLVRPPEGLIFSAIVFFVLVGAFDFLKAAIRLAVGGGRRRAFGDVMSGTALALFACLIYLYRDRTLSWQAVLAFEVIAIGLIIIMYSVIYYTLWKKPKEYSASTSQAETSKS